MYALDAGQVIQNAIKYLIEGLGVALAVFLVGKGKLKVEEIIMLGITAGAIYAVIDTLSPALGAPARLGSGLSIGAQVAGGF